MTSSRPEQYVEEYCRALPKKGEAKEVAAFMQYAKDVGLVNKFNTRESVHGMCNRYLWKRRKLEEEEKKRSITGGLRSPLSYSHSLADVLEIITLQKGTIPVGSYKYNIHKYVSLG